MAKDMRRFRDLAALAVAALALAGCGGSSADRLLTVDGLSQAAATTAESSSGRFTFGVDMTAPDGYEMISVSGYGSFDTRAERTALNLDMSAFGSILSGLADAAGRKAGPLANPELWQMEAVQDGLVLYMRFPLLSRIPDGLPRGKSWLKVDLRRVARAEGLDLAQLQQLAANDPSDALRCLEAVGGPLEAVGEEELQGVATTHYRTNVDLLRYERLVPASQQEKVGSMIGELVRESGLRMIPVDVWVDEDELVRKMTMSLSATPPGAGQTFEASIRYELYDYGQPVAIVAPPARKTVDVFELED
ncbi:MAG: hypothetical protein ACRDNY_07700 [Gaiellaceae bacterium]